MTPEEARRWVISHGVHIELTETDGCSIPHLPRGLKLPPDLIWALSDLPIGERRALTKTGASGRTREPAIPPAPLTMRENHAEPRHVPPNDHHATAPATIGGGRPFATISLAAMDGLTFPPVDWVIDDLIPAGALVLLVGRPKAGKSLLALDLLASVAGGETFLDRATTSGPVLYVAAEDSFPLVRDRLRTRFGAERQIPFHVLSVDGSFPDQSLRLDDTGDSLARLKATIEELRPAVICLDPLRELHDSKENDADEMSLLLRPLRQLAHEMNVTILLIHHRNKHGTDAATASRGSSAIVGGVDVIVTLDVSGDEESDLTPASNVLLHIEGRYGPRQKIGARLGTGLRWQATKVTVGADLALPARLLREIEMAPSPLTADDLTARTKAAKGSVQNALSSQVTKGHVTRIGTGRKGDPFRYALPGRAYDESNDAFTPVQQGQTPFRHTDSSSDDERVPGQENTEKMHHHNEDAIPLPCDDVSTETDETAWNIHHHNGDTTPVENDESFSDPRRDDIPAFIREMKGAAND